MSTIQSDCEAERVPSAHSKRGDVSVTEAEFEATAGADGEGFCVTGFRDRAQLAHKSTIRRAEAVRIASHPGGYAGSHRGELAPHVDLPACQFPRDRYNGPA